MNEGMLLILSAPSGCGKTTLLKRVMADLPGLVFSVSHTTRPPRPGEVNGRDYHFVERREFEAMRDRRPSGFLEWAEVHGNLYGTSREEVERLRAQGLDVVLDIDVQGAAQIRATWDPVTVFIAPPSLAELERRLRGRGTEAEETIALRLANGRREMETAGDYDYLVVNDVLDVAVDALRSIIVAERCRRRRMPSGEVVELEL
ncbi:MAG TPA: guanylate kinase [Desulfobulbus sp.]|nr:guanylate kinase [Desulfobulbus sp.]